MVKIFFKLLDLEEQRHEDLCKKIDKLLEKVDKRFTDNDKQFKSTQKTIRAIQLILEKQFDDQILDSEETESENATQEEDDLQSFFRQETIQTEAPGGRRKKRSNSGGGIGGKRNVRLILSNFLEWMVRRAVLTIRISIRFSSIVNSFKKDYNL